MKIKNFFKSNFAKHVLELNQNIFFNIEKNLVILNKPKKIKNGLNLMSEKFIIYNEVKYNNFEYTKRF